VVRIGNPKKIILDLSMRIFKPALISYAGDMPRSKKLYLLKDPGRRLLANENTPLAVVAGRRQGLVDMKPLYAMDNYFVSPDCFTGNI
jgi:hypothetical protein